MKKYITPNTECLHVCGTMLMYTISDGNGSGQTENPTPGTGGGGGSGSPVNAPGRLF